MPVEFRDTEDLAERGYTALLRVLRRNDEHGASFAGALLLVNALGEPVEFVHNRIGLPATSLCAPDRLPAFAAKSLVSSIFQACVNSPLLVLFPEGELDDELFAHRLEVGIPVGAVDLQAATAGAVARTLVRWLNAPPAPGSSALALLEALSNVVPDALARARDALRLIDADGSDDAVVG